MQNLALRAALESIAARAVPETTDLWPGLSRRLADRAPRPRLRRRGRVAGLAAAAALVVILGGTFVLPSMLGQMRTAQAADIARHDPEVAAALHGDIAVVTVTSVVDEVATVVVQDSRGQQVTVTVNLLNRIVTRVYRGPQLSADLAAEALTVVRADARTSALLASGAAFGQLSPIVVTAEKTDPTTGLPTQSTETWAQVPLELDGKQWMAYVDLTLGRVDQLIDPQGNQVPLP